MAFMIKLVIFLLFVTVGLIAITSCLASKIDEYETEEYPICAITGEHCRYDYVIYCSGNPCDMCKIFKECEEESNGEL